MESGIMYGSVGGYNIVLRVKRHSMDVWDNRRYNLGETRKLKI